MPKFTRLTALALCLGLLAGCSTAPGAQQNMSSPEATEAATAQTQQDTRAQSFGLSYQPDAGWNPYTCTLSLIHISEPTRH